MLWTETPRKVYITAKDKIRKHLMLSIIGLGIIAYLVFRKK